MKRPSKPTEEHFAGISLFEHLRRRGWEHDREAADPTAGNRQSGWPGLRDRPHRSGCPPYTAREGAERMGSFERFMNFVDDQGAPEEQCADEHSRRPSRAPTARSDSEGSGLKD